MSNDEPSVTGGTRRPPRQGVGGSPVGSTLSIVLAVVAVVVGFLILDDITDSGDDSAGGDAPSDVDDATGSTVADPTATSAQPATSAPTPTTPELVTEGASVLVANANSVGGSAGDMTKTLESRGYDLADPTNASGANLDATVVYFEGTIEAAEAVANSVARDLGGVAVEAMPTPPPTESGSLGEAGVLVVLGENEAGKSLDELAPADEPATGEAPAPAGAGTEAPATEAVPGTSDT